METQRLAGSYGPMLDALQQALEDSMGPLTWDPRADAREVAHHDGSRALRVGSIHAIGVPTARLELDAVSSAVNHVLARFGFPEQPPMAGSPSGHLVCEAADSKGAGFTLMIKSEVGAWVDQPL